MIRLQTFNRLWLLVLCLGAAQLQAVDFKKTRNGPLGPFVATTDTQIFLNPLGFAYGTPTLGLEEALSNDNSFTVQLGFRTLAYTGYDTSDFGVLGSYRWYLGDHAKMQGFYAGPLATLRLLNVSYDLGFPAHRELASGPLIGVGGETGYQWILPAHLTLGLGLNLGYYFGTLSYAAGAPSITTSGLGLGLQGSVGYAF
jgi:hypothetical protein